jgi:hypothetical protein
MEAVIGIALAIIAGLEIVLFTREVARNSRSTTG